MNNSTTPQATEGLRLRPIDWDATREILGPLFDAGDHWIIVAHHLAIPLVVRIEEKYYPGDKNGDITLIVVCWRGHMYVLAAAKKKHMQAYQLASLLRQVTGLKISDAETESRDVNISVPSALIEDATELAVFLFDGRELAIAA